MSRLTFRQVAQLAHDAGWRQPDLADAVAIAAAESALDPNAIGDVSLETRTWGPSVGLWQIRSLNVEKGTGGIRDESANRNARTNAFHAHSIWAAAGGFSPWSTFNSGAYKHFLPQAISAVGALLDARVLTRYLLETEPMQYGADVADCQRLVKTTPDGWFGPHTKAGVIAWQTAHQLVADGIVGPVTAQTFGWVWEGPSRG